MSQISSACDLDFLYTIGERKVVAHFRRSELISFVIAVSVLFMKK
jgi:hypothetical protein